MYLYDIQNVHTHIRIQYMYMYIVEYECIHIRTVFRVTVSVFGTQNLLS